VAGESARNAAGGLAGDIEIKSQFMAHLTRNGPSVNRSVRENLFAANIIQELT
jgi:hypothetical protein